MENLNLTSLRNHKFKLTLEEPKHFKAIAGMGVICEVKDQQVCLGNRHLTLDQNIAVNSNIECKLNDLENQGHTSMIVAINHETIGVMAVSDQLRLEAPAVINRLNAMGLKVWMISGDNQRTVESLARRLGITNFLSEVKPEHKRNKIQELQSYGSIVACIGDGINDSPALAQADVGMAIGTGTDVAIDTANVVLIRSNLWDVLTAIDLSRKTYNRIIFNFIWAFGYNLLAIPIASGIFYPLIKIMLPPWLAGLAMALSSVFVVVSSLLLKLYQSPHN